jgi:hypothetical protein
MSKLSNAPILDDLTGAYLLAVNGDSDCIFRVAPESLSSLLSGLCSSENTGIDIDFKYSEYSVEEGLFSAYSIDEKNGDFPIEDMLWLRISFKTVYQLGIREWFETIIDSNKFIYLRELDNPNIFALVKIQAATFTKDYIQIQPKIIFSNGNLVPNKTYRFSLMNVLESSGGQGVSLLNKDGKLRTLVVQNTNAQASFKVDPYDDNTILLSLAYLVNIGIGEQIYAGLDHSGGIHEHTFRSIKAASNYLTIYRNDFNTILIDLSQEVKDILNGTSTSSLSWRGIDPICPGNEGFKKYTTLEQYNTTTGEATGVTKPNVATELEYIPPVIDLTMCPILTCTIPVITNVTNYPEIPLTVTWTDDGEVTGRTTTIQFSVNGPYNWMELWSGNSGQSPQTFDFSQYNGAGWYNRMFYFRIINNGGGCDNATSETYSVLWNVKITTHAYFVPAHYTNPTNAAGWTICAPSAGNIFAHDCILSTPSPQIGTYIMNQHGLPAVKGNLDTWDGIDQAFNSFGIRWFRSNNNAYYLKIFDVDPETGMITGESAEFACSI